MLCSFSSRHFIRNDTSKKWLFSNLNKLQKEFNTPIGKWSTGGSRQSFQNARRSEKNNHQKPRLAPVEDISNFGIKYRRLVKPFFFTLAVGGFSFVGATIWQYENVHKQMNRLLRRSAGFDNDQLSLPRKKGEFRREANQVWNSLTEGQRSVLGIIGLNCLVFGAWRVPALRPAMVKYFCSNPAAKANCWPMLLSTFSHYSPWHLAANMYVLYTFSSSIVSVLGKEQFLAFYLTAGTVSSFASYVHKVLLKVPSMSLGASGAIMGVLAAVCVQVPNAKLAIIFFPWLTFSAGTALKGLLLLDTTGLVLRWNFFDHAAHLGGALFGISYIKWGQDNIWKRREPIIKWWHGLRTG